MTATRPASPQIPAHLHAHWRHLPRLAALALRRLGPRPVHPLTRPAAGWLWLFGLAVMHAGGRLLGYGSATLSVTGPRMSWPRRTAYTAVFLLGTAVTSLWLWLPLEAAAYAVTHHIPPAIAYGIALAAIAPLLLETGNVLLRGRAAVPAAITVHHLRKTGSTWWEAGTLLAHEDDQLSAGRLVRAALACADAQQVGLVVVPGSAETHRAYVRRGFIPGPLNPRVLIRHPRAATSTTTAQAR
ncbi:hypothetical protein [Streptomyces sp. 7N604]|uniref:hypothetical protein n=1 Tax=Streptomyces sp. 7N604 TaxID=3457415 RepID=UPI003FD3D942